MGPTRTLRMRLSSNFVNVYTIVYHVQYMYTCTRAHPQWTSSRGKARIGQKSADKLAVGLLHGRRRSEQARERRTRRLPREDPRAEVGVHVGPVEFKLNRLQQY